MKDYLKEISLDTNMGAVNGMPVTLFVAGGIVCGQIISASEYRQKRNELIASFVTTPDGKALVPPEFTKMQLDELQEPVFIFLDNAYLFETRKSTPLGLWRGKMDMIAGFSLGLLQSDENKA